MLYDWWCGIASERRNDLALRDIATGREWTFGQLQAANEGREPESGGIAYPQGHTAEFVITLLSAWRRGKVVCPLELGQPSPLVPKPPTNCVHLKSTSATTGTARVVAFTGEQLKADVDNIVATMGLRADWPNLGVISMAHSYGFSNLVLPLLLHGVPLILIPAPLPEAVRKAAEGFPALTLAAVPAMWKAWHQTGAIPRNIRQAISAGAPLPISLEQRVFEGVGLKIHNFYGSSECGGIAYDASEKPRGDEACAGAPMRNVDLSANEDGCLVVRGGAVAEMYWPHPSETLGKGRFQTTDIVELKDGLVYLRGRASDQINVAGRKVLPGTIENALNEHPSVDASLVFGVEGMDAERGDTIVACVVSAPLLSGDVLRQFLLERLPAWQLPREWWFVESLAPNRLGKLSRAEWRKKFLERRPDAA